MRAGVARSATEGLGAPEGLGASEGLGAADLDESPLVFEGAPECSTSVFLLRVVIR